MQTTRPQPHTLRIHHQHLDARHTAIAKYVGAAVKRVATQRFADADQQPIGTAPKIYRPQTNHHTDSANPISKPSTFLPIVSLL